MFQKLIRKFSVKKPKATFYEFVGQHISCPACGGGSELIATKDRAGNPLKTDICQECGLFFTNPMPTDGELSEFYKIAYRSDYMGASASVPKEHIKTKRADAANRGQLICNLLENPGDSRTLDFGCGLGELVLALERNGVDSYGFEPGEVWSKHAQNERIQQGDWQSVNFARNSFDLISIIHVLEHLRSPKDCLKKIENLLKDDGKLWVEVPDMQAYSSKGAKRFHLAHVLGFSRDNLISLCFDCGFYPIHEFSKEDVGKRRNQVSIVFRKRTNTDTLKINLKPTVEKNRREYGRD